MPRPKGCRLIKNHLGRYAFKPCGRIPPGFATQTLALEELEALRLADMNGLTAENASKQMGISRHTFGRILSAARKKTASALVQGEALVIEGGHYSLAIPSEEIIKKESKMKIAISSEGPDLNDQVDPRFGRAAGFVVIEKGGETQWVPNGANQTLNQGAGIGAAELMSQLGVTVVLSGYVGPKAFNALRAAGIKICQGLDNQTVAEALALFESGKAILADAPNAEGLR